MENHLFIGLGGFGGRTLAEIRKYEYLSQNTTERRPQVDYLYLDSSMDVYDAGERWKVLGRNLKLDPVDVIDLRDGSVSTDLHDVHNLPHVEPWIGDRETVEKLLTSAGDGIGANQRRRFGRFLFAMNVSRFLSAIDSKVEDMAEAECTFHIFATFAGGTGSGSIIDAITTIRSKYSSNKQYPINVYGYTTDKENTDDDIGFYAANQYSVMRDLNGIMVGKYQPQNLVSRRVERIDPHKKYINTVYLMTNENGRKQTLKPDEQVILVGQWVYHKVMSEVNGGIPRSVSKAFTGEDILAEYEGEKDENNNLIRSSRFAALGLKRWGIPEEQCQEALMLDYSEQALKQMLKNNWDSNNGFVYQAKGATADIDALLEYIGLDEESRWTLSLQDGNKPFEEEWKTAAGHVGFSMGLNSSIRRLGQDLERHKSQDFRNVGVESYFNAQMTTGVNQHSQIIESKINRWINSQWIDGEQGATELINSMRALSAYLKAEEKKFTEKKLADISFQTVETKWLNFSDKPGWLAKFAGIEKKMFEACRNEFVNICNQMTYGKSYKYAALLARRVNNLVEELISSLLQAEAKLELVLKNTQDERKPLLKFTEPQIDIVEFNREDYSNIWEAMKKDESLLIPMIRECRHSLISAGENFAALHAKKQSNIADSIKSKAAERVQHGHDQACGNNLSLTGKEVLGRNIWSVFENGDDQNLTHRVEQFMKESVTMVKRSKSAKSPNDFAPQIKAKMPREYVMLLNPAYNSDDEQVDLKGLFKAKRRSGTKLHFVEHGNQSEIVCLSVDSAIPARMFEVVRNLHDEYLESMESNVENCRYFCHLDPESESLSDHPTLL